MSCPDCGGSGKVVLFSSVEPCGACAGQGNPMLGHLEKAGGHLAEAYGHAVSLGHEADAQAIAAAMLAMHQIHMARIDEQPP